ncbi:MAG: TolC family protein [Saprospiraceae bacterium]|nr:TolC family protein [Saprospiraceae bacterium]MDP4999730.1 TolC family protein [Saprospiraceae bacterium]
MRKLGLFLLFAGFLGRLGWAQEALGLADAIAVALEQNYQIRIADKNIEIADRNNDWAVAGRFPSLDALLGFNNGYTNINNPASFLPELTSVSTAAIPGVEASMILFDGFRVQLSKQQLEQAARLSRGNANLAVEQVIQGVIAAYYAVLIQQEQMRVLEEVLTLSKDRIAYQETRQEFGQAGSFELLQSRDAYLSDSTNWLLQRNNLDAALRNLNLSMGLRDTEKAYVLTDRLDFSPADYMLEDLEARMLAANLTLQNLAISQELAGINTRLQESSKSATISARAGLTYNWSLSAGTGTLRTGETLSLDALTANTLNGFINVGASINLFDGGVRNRRIENARVEEQIAQFNLEDTRLRLHTRLRNTHAAYNNQKALLELSNRLLENARENLRIAEERLKGGQINSFDYRTIQLGYISAAQSRLNALYNLKNTETELLGLVGALVR